MPDRDRQARYPGYDVLTKRNTPSWNEKTRRVINQRIAVSHDPKFFTAEEFETVHALAARLVPQPRDRAAIPVPALVDHKLSTGKSDGYRQAGMPRQAEAWRQGLLALDAEAQAAHGAAFRELDAASQDALLTRMQQGEMHNDAWGSISPKTFFSHRMARDIVLAYYSHPTAWNEIGWGGPASPRGYVRTGYNERDPWEAAEVKDGDVDAARRKNRHV
jgi:hypothetical protein